LVLGLSVAGACVAVVGGRLGGELVYGHGLGVNNLARGGADSEGCDLGRTNEVSML